MIIAISSEVPVMSDIADRIWRDKSIVYIDTSSNGQEGDKAWLENQVGAIEVQYGKVERYSIEWKNISDFRVALWAYDIIHIWWGNTAYLLFHIMQTWFSNFLQEVESSKIIIGSSAGAKILGENIWHVRSLDDFSVVELNNYQGLWFFNFDIWAHFGKEKYRENYYRVLEVAYSNSPKWVYISDDSYIVSQDRKVDFFTVS